jgi:hypothetical protein
MGLLARLFRRLRRKPQQPVLDEHDAYERCHGDRVAEIRVVPAPPAQPRVLPRLPGDYLRRCFEERLESRHRKAAGPVEVLAAEAIKAARKSRNDDPGEPEHVAQVARTPSRDP